MSKCTNKNRSLPLSYLQATFTERNRQKTTHILFVHFTEVAVIQHLMFCMKKLIAYYDVNNQFVRLLR
mgnify:FL=1